jgi:hypothetical protein
MPHPCGARIQKACERGACRPHLPCRLGPPPQSQQANPHHRIPRRSRKGLPKMNRPNGALVSAWWPRISAAVLCLAVTVIHIMDQGGFPGSKTSRYVGMGYYLLEIAGVLAAVLLATRAVRAGWVLALGVAAGPLVRLHPVSRARAVRLHLWRGPLDLAARDSQPRGRRGATRLGRDGVPGRSARRVCDAPARRTIPAYGESLTYQRTITRCGERLEDSRKLHRPWLIARVVSEVAWLACSLLHFRSPAAQRLSCWHYWWLGNGRARGALSH